MLNIEVIKFEAQDVITASAVAKPVYATKKCDLCKQMIEEPNWKDECQGGWKHMFTL